jgi:hypothetical protein
MVMLTHSHEGRDWLTRCLHEREPLGAPRSCAARPTIGEAFLDGQPQVLGKQRADDPRDEEQTEEDADRGARVAHDDAGREAEQGEDRGVDAHHRDVAEH